MAALLALYMRLTLDLVPVISTCSNSFHAYMVQSERAVRARALAEKARALASGERPSAGRQAIPGQVSNLSI